MTHRAPKGDSGYHGYQPGASDPRETKPSSPRSERGVMAERPIEHNVPDGDVERGLGTDLAVHVAQGVAGAATAPVVSHLLPRPKDVPPPSDPPTTPPPATSSEAGP
jgi:hypothetical protein